MKVNVALSDSCKSVGSWGQPERSENRFSVDTEFWSTPGFCALVIVYESTEYNLGRLAPGDYSFAFRAWGQTLKTVSFSVPLPTPVLSRLEVLPGRWDFTGPGQIRKFRVVARYDDGSEDDPYPAVAWSSGDPLMVSIDATGLATSGSKGGQTYVRATSTEDPTLKDDAQVNVTGSGLRILSITRSAAGIAVTWADPVPGRKYVVDSAASLGAPWVPVASVAWPISGREWTGPMEAGHAAQFYRVRAEVDGKAAGIAWTRVSAASGPGPRSSAGFAWDRARGEAVLFGGGIHRSIWEQSDDTWVWKGGTWTQKFPANSPSPRRTHALVYDTRRSRVVLYGGEQSAFGNQGSNETWEWDGNDWTQQFPSVQPDATDHIRLAYDEARGRCVLFGGYGGGFRDETWTWDGNEWELQSPAVHPTGRIYHAMAYDPVRQRVVLFGGAGVDTEDHGETWEWDGTTWERKLPVVRPPGRVLHAMVYSARFGVASSLEATSPTMSTSTTPGSGTG